MNSHFRFSTNTISKGHIRNIFLSDPHETWYKRSSDKITIFDKFHEYMTKNVDFLVMANFGHGLFFDPDFISNSIVIIALCETI